MPGLINTHIIISPRYGSEVLSLMIGLSVCASVCLSVSLLA